MNKPRILLTMGDVAGIGPEIIAKVWPQLHERCRPIVIGDAGWLQRGLALASSSGRIQEIDRPEDARPDTRLIPCLRATKQDLSRVQPGRVSAEAGRAAYDFLCAAIDLTMAKRADAIVTAPLHKEGLRAAGLPYPGHTEILAERTGARQFAMALYGQNGQALTVVHVTLHMAIRDALAKITTAAVLEKITLLDELLRRLLGRQPRLGVAALNPHASDGGLFGDEEVRIIAPAVAQAQSHGMTASGPWPSDTLFVRATGGEFDGIVAMYHDQGHIAMKLHYGWNLVNISVGLPIIRASVAHGTAYDIVGKGIADGRSLVAATEVASRLAAAA
ncbi:MAG TPA: 4-hydroxythreonine-4-phosphate dehydrogenase PdxA [Gemmataceae bacterium]|jgi:4-hydroxythreonine-4-phosphate dehydrogenase|nr:4-hydroxythreonine-4-phosphate dehydrogenase PdxA [Gemmataceae bacterium]